MTKTGLILLTLLALMASPMLFASGAQDEPVQAEPTAAEPAAAEPAYLTFEGSHADNWKLEATDGLLIGGYGDNFVYDGKTVVPVEGKAMVNVNTKTNQGTMTAEFNGTITPEAGKSYTGDIRLEYTKFAEGSDFWEGGVADYVYLHGDTGQEAPVMPKVRTDLGSWGPVNVYVNDELVYENLAGHMMYTEGSRDRSTYALYNSDKSGFFSPMDPSNSSIAAPDEMELHFVAHTTESDSGNFPPHTVWLHLNFQNVTEL